MAANPSPDAWARIRHDYEHTERPVEDICAEHGISSGTLRDRMRRWGWTRRRPPIPLEGPPALPPPIDPPPLASVDPIPLGGPPYPRPPSDTPALAGMPPPLPAVPQAETAAPSLAPVAQIETAPIPFPLGGGGVGHSPIAAADTAGVCGEGHPFVPRLQSAVARVLLAIEAIVAKLAAGATHPRDLGRAAPALAALTRTLRELNGLLSRHQAAAASAADPDPVPEDTDAFRLELARRIHAFVAERTGAPDGDASPQGV